MVWVVVRALLLNLLWTAGLLAVTAVVLSVSPDLAPVVMALGACVLLIRAFRREWVLTTTSCLLAPLTMGGLNAYQFVQTSTPTAGGVWFPPDGWLFIPALAFGTAVGGLIGRAHRIVERDGRLFAAPSFAYLLLWPITFGFSLCLPLAGSLRGYAKSLPAGAFSASLVVAFSLVLFARFSNRRSRSAVSLIILAAALTVGAPRLRAAGTVDQATTFSCSAPWQVAPGVFGTGTGAVTITIDVAASRVFGRITGTARRPGGDRDVQIDDAFDGRYNSKSPTAGTFGAGIDHPGRRFQGIDGELVDGVLTGTAYADQLFGESESFGIRFSCGTPKAAASAPAPAAVTSPASPPGPASRPAPADIPPLASSDNRGVDRDVQHALDLITAANGRIALTIAVTVLLVAAGLNTTLSVASALAAQPVGPAPDAWGSSRSDIDTRSVPEIRSDLDETTSAVRSDLDARDDETRRSERRDVLRVATEQSAAEARQAVSLRAILGDAATRAAAEFREAGSTIADTSVAVATGVREAASDVANDPRILIDTLTGSLTTASEGATRALAGVAGLTAETGHLLAHPAELAERTRGVLRDLANAVTDMERVKRLAAELSGYENFAASVDPDRKLLDRLGQVAAGVLKVAAAADGAGAIGSAARGAGAELGAAAARVEGAAVDAADAAVTTVRTPVEPIPAPAPTVETPPPPSAPTVIEESAPTSEAPAPQQWRPRRTPPGHVDTVELVEGPKASGHTDAGGSLEAADRFRSGRYVEVDIETLNVKDVAKLSGEEDRLVRGKVRVWVPNQEEIEAHHLHAIRNREDPRQVNRNLQPMIDAALQHARRRLGEW